MLGMGDIDSRKRDYLEIQMWTSVYANSAIDPPNQWPISPNDVAYFGDVVPVDLVICEIEVNIRDWRPNIIERTIRMVGHVHENARGLRQRLSTWRHIDILVEVWELGYETAIGCRLHLDKPSLKCQCEFEVLRRTRDSIPAT